ncbi:sodium-coupled monocarboxylate transporter 1-like [Homarus americanus]|uniref:sodium-coupled monocarboxylate transporter 1-like n=1 Tax=Homarus americanus TaxID=6706 RepID=UPI001C47A0E9|nr:sodium-coupled monocarboxylate transporter 1-like [Homarus americanus]
MAGFSGWDWAVFAVSLAISLGTGIWAGLVARKNTAKGDSMARASEFLMGGRNMNPIAIALSTTIGALSSITVLGNAAEMYAYGTQLWMNLIGMSLGFVYVHLVNLTVLYPLKITSVYTYIERRFKSKNLRAFTVYTTFIGTFFFMGLCAYTPSLAMETITGIPSWASVIVLGVTCTIYSSWGGVRAVVYTDIFQSFVMMGGLLFIAVTATIETGGLEKVWSIADAHGRVEWWNINPDPLQRESFWLVTVQGYFLSLLVLGMGQPQVQRVCSVSSWKRAISTHYLNMVLFIAVYSCCYFMGIAVFSVYADCDPMATGDISTPDQIIPYYTIDKLSVYYGLPGIFIASLYAGSLSSYSAQINAVSAVLWEDFFKNSNWVANMAEERRPNVNVLVSVITGTVGIVAGIIASQLGGIFQMGQTILGTIHAPLLGLFILGMCCPFANKIGGTVGFVTSLTFNLWVTCGTMVYGRPPKTLDFSDAGCNVTTTTMDALTTYPDFHTTDLPSTTPDPGNDYVFPLYLVSYTLYALFGVSITFFVGSIVSLIFKPWSTDVTGKDLVHKTFYNLMRKWEKRYTPEDPAASSKNLVPLEKY